MGRQVFGISFNELSKLELTLKSLNRHGLWVFPFGVSEHRRIAVKVIDFRGNEVMRVSPLVGTTYDAHRRWSYEND